MVSQVKENQADDKERGHHEQEPAETDPQTLQVLDLSDTDYKTTVL